MPRTTFPTAWGDCGLTWSETGLTGVQLPGPSRGGPAAPLADAPGWVRDLAERIQKHFGGELQDFADVPLDPGAVPPFAQRVYAEARTVKAGHTVTYGELAARLGEGTDASRAVGAALGSNPWPLIVPCHRILGAGGRLTGFSAPGGVRTKARLLALEGAQLLAE